MKSVIFPAAPVASGIPVARQIVIVRTEIARPAHAGRIENEGA